MIQSSDKVNIANLTEAVIQSYFETLNGGEFSKTANLFTLDGSLHPPFESPVVGQDAIAAYLQQEAKGMKLYPLKEILQPSETDHIQAKITGRVKTSLFSVNVAWTFVLNEDKKIVSVEVKLLASLEELVKLKR
jgi:hypothetical protein